MADEEPKPMEDEPLDVRKERAKIQQLQQLQLLMQSYQDEVKSHTGRLEAKLEKKQTAGEGLKNFHDAIKLRVSKLHEQMTKLLDGE